MTSGTPAPGATQPGGCPDPQRLEELLRADARPDAGAGTGTGAGADLARHLEACAACRRRLDDLAGGSDWLARLSAGGVTSDTVDANAMPPLLQAVMDELRHSPGASPDANVSPDSEAGVKVPEIDFLEPCTLPGYRGRFGP